MRAFSANMRLILADGIGGLLCGRVGEGRRDNSHFEIWNFFVRVTLRVTV
nr:MAG TPA: hypothetical protein [Caudoviricetes sp.]